MSLLPGKGSYSPGQRAKTSPANLRKRSIRRIPGVLANGRPLILIQGNVIWGGFVTECIVQSCSLIRLVISFVFIGD